VVFSLEMFEGFSTFTRCALSTPSASEPSITDDDLRSIRARAEARTSTRPTR
jgi:hypothetical protein